MNDPQDADLPPMTLRDWYVLAWRRRTTLLGYIVIALGVLAASDNIIPPHALKFLILLNGIVTAALGHYNASVLKRQAPENPAKVTS